jgi:sugar-specific transcriptional regulator TrmB
MRRRRPANSLLTGFGFTDLESRLYVQLMRHAPATGYRLAQLLGKAPANTYQALAGLIRKGAAVSDETEPKTYRAIDPAELFAGLRQSFDAEARQAVAALSAMHSPVEEDRLYRLKSVSQALLRARTLIEGARRILLFDLFPEPHAMLRDALTAATRRGVTVAGLVYEAPTDSPYTQVPSASAGFVAEHWPGQQLSLVVDGQEVLLGLLARDAEELLQGLWSDSAYLACLHHSGLSAEIRLAARAGSGNDPLEHLSLLTSRPQGLQRLLDPGRAAVTA